MVAIPNREHPANGGSKLPSDHAQLWSEQTKDRRKGGAHTVVIRGGCSGIAGGGQRPKDVSAKTCCRRRCYNRWPLEKLARARSAVPQSCQALPSSSSSGSSKRSDSDVGTGAAGDGGGDSDASATAYAKSCLSHNTKLLYITSGRESLPVCRAFFSALTGISQDVIESAARRIEPTVRKIKPGGSKIKPGVSKIHTVDRGSKITPGVSKIHTIDPVIQKKPLLGRTAFVPKRRRVPPSPAWPSGRTKEEVKLFIEELANHWERRGDGNWIAMTYPSKQMVYDLFASTWNKHRTAKNCRPPAPSYGRFVGTWTRNFEHVTLKRRPDKPHHGCPAIAGEGQEQQQGLPRPSSPEACQTNSVVDVDAAAARWRRNARA